MEEKRSDILKEAQNYAEEILKNKLSDHITYHTLRHTREVVKAAKEIGQHSNISPEEAEIVELAAWFHDLGYTQVVKDHEKVSANMVLDFLTARAYDDQKTARIAGCILATKMPQTPKNLLEAILCDADMAHLGKEDYFDKTVLLQEEIGNLTGKEPDDREWLQASKQFIESHTYFTEYATNHFARVKKNNLLHLEERMKDHNPEKGH